MDVQMKKNLTVISSGDSDSGLDNLSDSGPSGDDDYSAISSDFEDFPYSDNESNLKNIKTDNDVREKKVDGDLPGKKVDNCLLEKVVDSPLPGKKLKLSLHGKKPIGFPKKKAGKSSTSNPSKVYRTIPKSFASHSDSAKSKKFPRPIPESYDANSDLSSQMRFKKFKNSLPAKSNAMPLATDEKVSSQVLNKYAAQSNLVSSLTDSERLSNPAPIKYSTKSDERLSSVDSIRVPSLDRLTHAITLNEIPSSNSEKVSKPVPVPVTVSVPIKYSAKSDERLSSVDSVKVSNLVHFAHTANPDEIFSPADSEKVSSPVANKYAAKSEEMLPSVDAIKASNLAHVAQAANPDKIFPSADFEKVSISVPDTHTPKPDKLFSSADFEKVSSSMPDTHVTKPDGILSPEDTKKALRPVSNKDDTKPDGILSAAEIEKASSSVPITHAEKPDEILSSAAVEKVSGSVPDRHAKKSDGILSPAHTKKALRPVSNKDDSKSDGILLSADAEKASSTVHDSHVAYEDKIPLANGTKDENTRIQEGYQVPKEYQEVLEFYKSLSMSQSETVDFTRKWDKPEWLDEEKFKRGQKFARDHLFCINFAEMLSLFILFAQKSSLGPLIFTGKSDTPYTSFKRYLSTLNKLMSWYQDDIWNDGESAGHRNIAIVRRMHKTVYHKLTETPEEELAKKTTLGDSSTTALWCPLRDVLIEDLRNSIQPAHEDLDRHLTKKKVWVNQADMSMTQFGFVGLAVTYPEYFGIYQNSDEDLDAFLHLWRGLGYLLGIKDQYNYCNDSLEAIRRRTKFFLEVMAKPAFRNVTCDWEHMSRCLTAGISFYLPQVNFESAFLYLCHILQINTPKLRKKISYRSYIVFQVHRFVFYLMRFARVKNWFNSRLYKIIKKAENTSPEVLSKWENKEYPYMNQAGKCPIRCEIVNRNS